MDILKAEIAKRKKEIQEKEVLISNKTYFKRGDLARKETEEYWKSSKRLKPDLLEPAAVHSALEKSESDDTSQPSSSNVEGATLPRKEVVRRLRERNEPIRLFGETDFEAFQRLKKVEMLLPEINKGFNNDLKTAMDEVDQKYLEEIVHSTGQEKEDTAQKGSDVTVKHDGTTMDDLVELSKGLEQGDRPFKSDLCLKFLKLVLYVWGEELNKRSAELKRSFQGKLASATHSQTVAYIKPLFKKLKRKELSEDILECLADIINKMIERHYLKANDAYLEMAIGNAPWPIGVTMVGIHARTGREKIFAKNVAHVLNDETQRKYIQAVKRIMTQCQKFFPTDPSRSVDFDKNL